MCLAVPVRIEKLTSPATGVVSLAGVSRAVDLSLIDNPQPGDFVLLHAGYAIEKMDEAEAQRTLALFRDILAEDAAENPGGGQ